VAADGGLGLDSIDDDLVGAVVADRFVVERLIGEGGIGRVWLARQPKLDRMVAVKMLHPHLSHRADMAERFDREARATSRLNHPGCATVFDYGSWQNRLYIAMEYVDGQSLADVLQVRYCLPPDEVQTIGIQLCSVLDAAHRVDLLHRDLKPENILLARDRDGSTLVKVVDFGLAFVLGEEATRLTREGTVAGTPAYMAPEQALNRTLDGRADLYAIGCVLYELLAGQQPHVGENAFVTLQKQIYDKPIPLSLLVPGVVPEALERIVMRCLEKKPDLRPANADTLGRLLKSALTSEAGQRNGAIEAGRTRKERGALVVPVTRDAVRPGRDKIPTAPDANSAIATIWQTLDLKSFSDSLAATLGHHGLGTLEVNALPEAIETPVLIVEMRGLARSDGLVMLRAALAHPSAPHVVAIGSDDDFELMAEALALGVGDFLTAAALSALPKRLLRAVKRPRARDYRPLDAKIGADPIVIGRKDTV